MKGKQTKRYRIKFGWPRKECIDYCNGKLERKSNEECNDTILLVNEEGEAIKNLQSYFNEKKVIYCYNPQQNENEYIGHFKKTEKGISVSRSKKGPTQSQEQPKEQTNAKSQPTKSTQTTQQTSSSEQLQEKKYELADYQPIEHIFNYLTHPVAMRPFPKLDKRQALTTKKIKETEYTKKTII